MDEGTPKTTVVTADLPSATTTIFLDAIRSTNPAKTTAAASELEVFFHGTYPCLDGDVLRWWKVSVHVCVPCNSWLLTITTLLQTHESDFPVLACIAWDILAIPGVSISVERLFSSSKHTLSDSRSSLTAESASKTVVTKEWLKKGLGDGMNYLDISTEN